MDGPGNSLDLFFLPFFFKSFLFFILFIPLGGARTHTDTDGGKRRGLESFLEPGESVPDTFKSWMGEKKEGRIFLFYF